MTSIFRRGKKLYAKIKGADDEWRQLATGFSVGEEPAAEKWAAEREHEVERVRKARGGEKGPLTLASWIETWLSKRKTATVKDDRTRLEKHVVPRIGHLLLVEVRPSTLRDLILELRADATLAPKTIREIAGVLHNCLKSAVIYELIPTNPAIYERGVLPAKLDADPTWRATAIYTRAEIETLLSSEQVPLDRRVMYALKFFVGRHSEISALHWRDYDPTAKPLGAIHLSKTKTKIPRSVPVHPVLAALLAERKLAVGAKADDRIVTTRAGDTRSPDEAQERLVDDLRKLGLRIEAGDQERAKKRRRRGHDLRRTFITLARSDGAIDSLLRWVTHGPRRSEILDVYSTPPWESLCREVAKLQLRLLGAAAVTELGAAG